MTARKLGIITAAFASSMVLAAAPAQASGPSAQASGLGNLLGGSTGALLGQIDPTGGVVTDLAGEVIGTVDASTGTLLSPLGEVIGTVDAATGTILDPAGNIIGLVLPPASGAGSGGSAPGSPGAPGSTEPSGSSSLSMVLSTSRAQRLATVKRQGLSARTACSAACGVLAAVAVDGRTAKRLRIGNGLRSEIVGTSVSAPGSMKIRLSSRARRALSSVLPSSRTRKRTRSKRIRAQRQSRSRSATSRQRSRARRSYLRYRKLERGWISSGRVKFTVAAVGMDPEGRTTTIRRQTLVVKR